MTFIGKAWRTYLGGCLTSDQINVVPIKWHVERLPIILRHVRVGRIHHNLYIALRQGFVENTKFVHLTGVIAMVPIVESWPSGTNMQFLATCPIDRCLKVGAQHFNPIEIDGTLCLGYGNCNVHPLASSHINNSSIIPAFCSTGSHIQFDPLFIGISFPEETKSLVSIVGIVANDQYSSPIRRWIYLVPETGTELCALKSFHRKSQVGILCALKSIGSQEGISSKTWIAHFPGFLETNEVHIICIERHVQHLTIELGTIRRQFGKVYFLCCGLSFGIGSRDRYGVVPIAQSIISNFLQYDAVVFKGVESRYLRTIHRNGHIDHFDIIGNFKGDVYGCLLFKGHELHSFGRISNGYLRSGFIHSCIHCRYGVDSFVTGNHQKPQKHHYGFYCIFHLVLFI